jgi:hypothetical protein
VNFRAAAFQSTDLYRLKSVGDVHLSPDGSRIAYHDYLAVEFGALPHEMWRQHAKAQER